MKHFGDITKLKGNELPFVDIITGGSPCQDLSVAGHRKGLLHADLGDGETTRSGLFMEQIRIIKEMRNECAEQLRMRGSDVDIRLLKPRFMVWENVPGAFSSNKGEDFRAVLEETAKIADQNTTIPRPSDGKWTPAGCIMGDGWSIAWRVHDAQFWGVPQRRKRIALVADFAGGGAPEILFERESLPRNTEQSETEREEVTGTIGTGIDKAITFQERGGRPGGGKGILIQNDRTGALSTVNNQMVFDASRRHDYQQFEDVCETVQAHYGSGGGNVPMVVNEVVVLNDQGGSVMGVSKNITGALREQEHGHQPIVFEPGAASRVGGHVYEDKAGTVRANAGDNQQAVVVSDDCYAIQGNCIDRADTAGCNGKGWRKDKGYTLNTMDRHAVVYGISSYNSNAMKSDNPNSGIYEAETARTLDLNGGNPACNQGGNVVLQSNVSVESGVNEDCVLLLESNQNHATIQTDGICTALPAAMGEGGGYVPMVVSSYQDKTGSLMASGYDKFGTQEAMNDMFVVDGCAWDGSQISSTLTCKSNEQRMPDKNNFNAVIQSVQGIDCYNQAITGDKTMSITGAATDTHHIPSVMCLNDQGGSQVCYGLDRASFNQGQNAQFNFSIEEELAQTLVSKGAGGVLTQLVPYVQETTKE